MRVFGLARNNPGPAGQAALAEKLADQRESRAIIPLRAGVCIAIFVKLFQKSRITGRKLWQRSITA